MDTAQTEVNSLIEQYYSPLLCFVRSHIGSMSDAEDIVQETWIRSFGAIGTGTIQNVRAYLHRVARNLMVDHLRAGRRQSPIEDSFFLSLPDTRIDMERDLMRKKELECVEIAMKEMSERSRQIFLLARVEGLSYAKIGRKLGISRQTVHEHMARAIRTLEQSLDSQNQP